MKYLSEIIYLLGEEKTKLKFLLVLFLVVSFLDLLGLGLIAPYITFIVDPSGVKEGVLGPFILKFGLPEDILDLSIIFGTLLFFVFLVKVVVIIYINYFIASFSQYQQVRLRSHLMSSYQNLPYTEYLQRNSSEYIYSMQVLVEQFSSQVVLTGLRTIGDSIVAFAIFLLLAWTNGYAFSLLVVLLGLIIFCYDFIFRGRLKNYGVESNKASTSILKGVSEGIEGLKEIRVLGKLKHFHKKVLNGAEKLAYNQIRFQVITTSPRYLLELLLVGFVVLVVIVSVVSGEDTAKLLPVLGVFGVAAMRLMPIANGLSNSLTRLRYGRDAVSILYKDLLSLEKIQTKPDDKNVLNSENFLSLSLNQINFSYPGTDRLSLNQVSLSIKAGESIGIIGHSGSGKTTLIDLLLGLIKPDKGSISFNSSSFEDKLPHWRKQVAYLPQQVFLIDNTLKSNVALGIDESNIDHSLLLEALEKSKLSELIDQLPEGVDTLIGERGVRLSGGQRQRVALARAFYHQRSVLVMDESTSALDDKTEREIANEINRLKGVITTIIIAHRLTSVKDCDRIYLLENGKIISHGPPKKMLNISSD
jgi:ATP-binding cassette, subfamily B, bacterial PglK